MEREKFQEFSPSSASHSRKFEQDSERRNFFKNGALVRIQGKEHSSAYHAPVIDMGLSQLPLMLTLLRSLRLPSTAMSPVQICVIHQTKFLSEHESSNGAGEISRNFLQVLRATRENSSKILRGEISSKKVLGRNLENIPLSSTHL